MTKPHIYKRGNYWYVKLQNSVAFCLDYEGACYFARRHEDG